MGWNNGGDSRRKVNKEGLISELLRRVKAADDDKSLTQSTRTKKHQRTAQFVKTYLFEDGRKTDDQYDDDGNLIKKGTRLSRGSYIRYLSEVRRAVRSEGLHHHMLAQRVEKLKAKWPEFKRDLDLVLSGVGYDKKKALDRLKAKAQLKRDGEKGRKYRTAYDDFDALRTDHDVCRFLRVMAIDKDEHNDEAKRTLTKVNAKKIRVNYKWVIRTIGELVDEESYTKRALGLALASGRRSIEILYYAKFKVIGEYQVRFSGQVKERKGGVDYKTTIDIYTLIPAKLFVKKFNEFRRMKNVQDLHEFDDLTESERNISINKRTAKTLSEAAKRTFPHERRGHKGKMERIGQFKWSRAIWANAILETFYKTEDEWKGVARSNFLQQMLGHDSPDIQFHYYYIDIDMGEEKDIKKTSIYINKKGESVRAKKLKALSDNTAIADRSAFGKINDFLIEKLTETPELVVTQSYITRELGSARPVIQEYFDFILSELGDIFGIEKRKAELEKRKKGYA